MLDVDVAPAWGMGWLLVVCPSVIIGEKRYEYVRL